MKRLLIIALVLCMAAPAHAQLNIRKAGDKYKQVATLTSMWNWLYTREGSWYFVTRTTNEFDDHIFIPLGDSPEGALESVQQLSGIIEEMGEEEGFEIPDVLGKPLRLTLYKSLGKRYGLAVSAPGRSGTGYIYTPSLKKVVAEIKKEAAKQAREAAVAAEP